MVKDLDHNKKNFKNAKKEKNNKTQNVFFKTFSQKELNSWISCKTFLQIKQSSQSTKKHVETYRFLTY